MRGTTDVALRPEPGGAVEAPTPAPRRLVVWLPKLALLGATTVVCLTLVEIGFGVAGFERTGAVYAMPELFWT